MKPDSKINYAFILTFIAGLLVGLLLFSCASANAQVVLTPSVGNSVIHGMLGLELQGSNVSIAGGWTPAVDNLQNKINCYSLSGAFYVFAYRTSPYFSTGIVTHGRYEVSEVTGKSPRSFVAVIGVRCYPVDFAPKMSKRLSVQLGGGINIAEQRGIVPSIDFGIKYEIFRIN